MGKIEVKGQAALEYLFVVGLILLVLIPLFSLSYNRVNVSVTLSDASTAANLIAKTADEVYFLGPGNRNTIDVYFPSSIDSVNISGREIIFYLNIFDEGAEIFQISKANLTGSLSNFKGTHIVVIEYLDSGMLNITEK
ncbi:hypothetical protein J4414_02550 [Candidatus Woesearchaeota archaeon]|nr:hypothetical protein [Candidatus Woesearchaeota archaeon]